MPNPNDRIFKAQQITAHKIAEKKLPAWADNNNIIYPPDLSMQQCSSQITAEFKQSLISGDTLADLTGGFGVDCAYLSKKFEHTYYIEQQAHLCEIAKHNFKVLDININITNALSADFLSTSPHLSCIYLDPARRDKKGGKVFSITDCEPNILDIQDLLLSKANKILIKLSPMLDIKATLDSLSTVHELYIISVKNECKELLVVLTPDSEQECKIKCVNLPNNHHFEFSFVEEQNAEITYSLPQKYLYEPNSSILKAGAFKSIANYYNLSKLHINSHLYTSNELIENFQGRIFEITNITTVQKKSLNGLKQANLAIRNFFGSVAELRKKLKLAEGGDTYLYATTLLNEKKVLLHCNRINNSQ